MKGGRGGRTSSIVRAIRQDSDPADVPRHARVCETHTFSARRRASLVLCTARPGFFCAPCRQRHASSQRPARLPVKFRLVPSVISQVAPLCVASDRMRRQQRHTHHPCLTGGADAHVGLSRAADPAPASILQQRTSQSDDPACSHAKHRFCRPVFKSQNLLARRLMHPETTQPGEKRRLRLVGNLSACVGSTPTDRWTLLWITEYLLLFLLRCSSTDQSSPGCRIVMSGCNVAEWYCAALSVLFVVRSNSRVQEARTATVS